MKGIYAKKFIKNRAASIIASSVFLTIAAFLSTSFAFILAYIIDSALNLNMSDFKRMSIYAFIWVISAVLFELVGDNIRKKYSSQIIYEYKAELLNKTLSRNIRDYVSKPEAYYINILNDESNLIREKFFMQISAIIQNFMQVIFGIAALLFVSWKLFLATVVLFLLTMILPGLLSKTFNQKVVSLTEASERYISYSKSILSSFEVIKTFSIKDKILQDFQKKNEAREKRQYEVGKVENIRNSISTASSFLVQMGSIIVGVYLIFKKDLSVTMLFAGIQIVGTIVSPIQDIIQRSTWILGTKEILKKHNDIFSEINDNEISSNTICENFRINKIKLDNVSFKYDGNSKFSIQDINYTFRNNKKYAIIGPSGSGKSTILNLLMFYYSDYEGNMYVNDYDYKDMNIDNLYDHMSIMHQNVVLLEDTFENNIKLFKKVDETRFNNILQITGLENVYNRFSLEDSSLPYDNLELLSGGEKQRVAIARSLIKKSEVILFDEATASLDPQNTKNIYDILFRLKDIMFIAVTHDWSDDLLERFDEVLYVNNGRLMMHGKWGDIKDKVI